ncbi:MAG: alpha/beta hydrolase [Rhodoferax sp.]|nr:alpha/beta hydrolase [Rhodoferax sp.]
MPLAGAFWQARSDLAARVESTLSTFTAVDGENLAVQDWPLAEDVPLRGVVLVVHGLGEHAARYDHLAQRLNGWGFAVRGYDQYGHGESGGSRGTLPSDGRLIDDLEDVLTSTRARMPRGMPLVLLGHSLGALVAARYTVLRRGAVEGLVLSSPGLAQAPHGVGGMNSMKRLALAALPTLAPNLRLHNGLDPALLSHDPAMVRAYRADRFCHQRMSARMARFIADSGPIVLAHAAAWRVPTLLLYAGEDRLASPEGSRAFAAAAPPEFVTAQCFDSLYHDLFNELDNEPVFERLRMWLAARF